MCTRKGWLTTGLSGIERQRSVTFAHIDSLHPIRWYQSSIIDQKHICDDDLYFQGRNRGNIWSYGRWYVVDQPFDPQLIDSLILGNEDDDEESENDDELPEESRVWKVKVEE